MPRSRAHLPVLLRAATAAALSGGLLVAGAAAPASAAGTVTARYDAVTRQLLITGDDLANHVLVSRDAAGTLTVRSDFFPLPVTGGPATTANTNSVVIRTGGGDDVAIMDEFGTAGPLPRALLVLGAGADRGTGGSGADLIVGEDGEDVLTGGPGADGISGGDGDDFVFGGKGNDSSAGDSGDDTFIWSPNEDGESADGGPGVDRFEARGSLTGDFVDLRFPAAGPAQMSFSGGGSASMVTEEVFVDGSVGSDTMLVSGAAPAGVSVTLFGGAGVDSIFGGAGPERIIGGLDADTLLGFGGADTLSGSDGDDALEGGPGADTVEGDRGDDLVTWRPGDGDDVVTGGDDDDAVQVLTGGAPDTVGVLAAAGGRVAVRSPGSFEIRLDAERIDVLGGDANDNLSVGVGIGLLTKVRLDGGAGDDRLNGNEGREDLVGGDGNDLLFGEGGDDRLTGGAGADQAIGGPGHDIADGGDGDDVLFGNGGNDNLDGGPGFDFLRGGTGLDVGFNGEDVASIP